VKGQKAGTHPYTITFKVIGDRKASRVYLYPNPVRGTSHFVFTLTGDEVPDLLSIQIFNLRGQLVNEINLAGSGRFIGHNEVAWDGTAANGNVLPNGVYLYRVILKKSGKELPIHPVPLDRDLEKTYGKILIQRE
jgi:flagellar hook assembly protein FlgD